MTLQPSSLPESLPPKGQAAMTNTSFDAAGTAAREQFEKAHQNAYKSFEEISKLQKDNWDAFVASSQIWAKGAEIIGKAWMGLAQEAIENAATTTKALVGVKSLREAVDLQTDLAKGNFDKFVAESTKVSETMVKVANDAMEPLAARMNVNVEKMFKPVAA
jgi:phasin family protein